MANGYDALSAPFARTGRVTVAEASGDKRSDGQASQTRSGSNRFDTSTPEKRRKALASARRSGNPADEAQVRRQINKESLSSIDTMMGGLANRDNRVTREGGYRSPGLGMDEAMDAEKDRRVNEAGAAGNRDREEMGEAKGDLPPWMQDKEKVKEAKGDLPPWLKDKKGKGGSDKNGEKDDSNLPPWLRGKDADAKGSGGKGKKRRGKVAESALNPQIRFRETVNNGDFFDEAESISSPAQARSALSRAKDAGPGEYARVRRAVTAKFPDLKVQ